MTDDLRCPVCTMDDLLDAGVFHECNTCGHEWPKADGAGLVVHDANGNRLSDGDAVILTKGLKVKGAADIKAGTRVTGIRLVEGDHQIDCRVNGTPMMLKAEFVKKA